MPSIPPATGADVDVDINTWNANAEAQLREEFQTMAIAAARDAEVAPALKGLHDSFHYVAGTAGVAAMAAPTALRSTTPGSLFSSGRIIAGPRMLTTVAFTMGAIVVRALPAIHAASPEDRREAIMTMIKDVVASAVVAGLAANVATAIETALLGQCEAITANCLAHINTKTCAEVIANNVSAVTTIPVALVINAFKTLWHYIAAIQASQQSPPRIDTAEAEVASANECWSPDQLVRACANSVAVALCYKLTEVLPLTLGGKAIVASVLNVALMSIVEFVINGKNELGGWGAWFKSWIITGEHAWSSPSFYAVEAQITKNLICPITLALVVDPVVGGPCGQVYERAALYRHLKAFGRDPMSNVPASALSYKRSNVAAKLAAEIAQRYGAKLEKC